MEGVVCLERMRVSGVSLVVTPPASRPLGLPLPARTQNAGVGVGFPRDPRERHCAGADRRHAGDGKTQPGSRGRRQRKGGEWGVGRLFFSRVVALLQILAIGSVFFFLRCSELKKLFWYASDGATLLLSARHEIEPLSVSAIAIISGSVPSVKLP